MLNKIVVLLFCFFNITFTNPINYNLNLVSNIQIENSSNNYGVSDVWGYTDETGIEYAIIGYQYGTYIYSLASTEPILIADIIGPSSGDYYFHRDYKTYNNHLYIVNEMYGGDIGMQVVDLTPLPENSPIQLDTYNEMSQSHNLWIDNDSGLAFIEHQNGDNIHIANLSDPENPSYAGTFGNQGYNCHDIFTRNQIGYISEGWSGRFGIYDIADLANITELASIPCEGYAHNAWLNDQGSHLITTEETENKTIKIWDISDLNNITLEGEYLGENGLAHNVHVMNDLLYISHYSTGIKIVDIFNTERPIEVAAYDTYPLNNDGGYIGCWGAYPFTSNGYVYASDMQYGLYVFNFDEVFAGFIDGYIYYNEDNPATNSSIKSLLNNKTYLTNSNGYFNFGHAEGIHEFLINETDTIQMTILPRQQLNQDYFITNDFILGDINQDNTIDVLDVILVINFIMEVNSPNNQENFLSDINADGGINIQDIILIVNIILYN